MRDPCVACGTRERADGWTKCPECMAARVAGEAKYRERIEKERRARKRLERAGPKCLDNADADEQIGMLPRCVRVLEGE